MRICARFSSGAFGSKFAAAAMSLRIVISVIGLSVVLTIASSRWPFAAARVSDSPEICANSALPEITALVEPMPAMMMVFTRRPCFSQSLSPSAM